MNQTTLNVLHSLHFDNNIEDGNITYTLRGYKFEKEGELQEMFAPSDTVTNPMYDYRTDPDLVNGGVETKYKVDFKPGELAIAEIYTREGDHVILHLAFSADPYHPNVFIIACESIDIQSIDTPQEEEYNEEFDIQAVVCPVDGGDENECMQGLSNRELLDELEIWKGTNIFPVEDPDLMHAPYPIYNQDLESVSYWCRVRVKK